MHPLKKIVTGLAFATAGLLPLSAGAVTAPSMADAHTNSALPANSIGDSNGFHQSSNNSPYSGGILGKARRRAARHGVARRRETDPNFIGKTWSPINSAN